MLLYMFVLIDFMEEFVILLFRNLLLRRSFFMFENQVSLTAIMTAYCRAYHAMNDDPKIFDDSLAYLLIPEERRTLIEQDLSLRSKN